MLCRICSQWDHFRSTELLFRMPVRKQTKKRNRKAKPGSKGLIPAECRSEAMDRASADLASAVEQTGGCLIGTYKEPLGGHSVLLAVLPIDAVVLTPFQRDLSEAHHKRLAGVIEKTGVSSIPSPR
jgi:ParB family chromosome partitioning protein